MTFKNINTVYVLHVVILFCVGHFLYNYIIFLAFPIYAMLVDSNVIKLKYFVKNDTALYNNYQRQKIW